MNLYPTAECSISLRLKEYRNELTSHLKGTNNKNETELIDRIIEAKAKQLIDEYAKRSPSDVNWQITLNKKVKRLLTEDSYSAEEKYYGQKPGHYVRALLEEYARKPYYSRERIVFKEIIDNANFAIDSCYLLNITNVNGHQYWIKPHSIKTDPLSMFHYLVGLKMDSIGSPVNKSKANSSNNVISFRISRLISAEPQYLSSGKLSKAELSTINHELETKSIQFVSSEKQSIKVWLSDDGIKQYESHVHLRPPVKCTDQANEHIYYFECTETQILFYFCFFVSEALILDPPELADRFKEKYKEAYEAYEK